jgi:4-amino-4-deoxy-L-arabinose transferase-like glycosyltransferase
MALFTTVLAYPERTILPDSEKYIIYAENIMEGKGFSLQKDPPYAPSAFNTPLYPLFIATIYKIFGKNVLIVAFIQIIFSTLTVLLTYYLGRYFFSEKIAYYGSLLFAFGLGPIVYSILLLTETLFTLLLLAGILCLFMYSSHNETKWIIFAGVLIGLSILCRPIALFLPVILAIILFLLFLNSYRNIYISILIFLVSVACIITPWVIRNYRSLGVANVSIISSYNLLFYNATALKADIENLKQSAVRTDFRNRINEECIKENCINDEGKQVKMYYEWGKKIILSNPYRYMFIHLKQNLNSLLPAVNDFFEVLGIVQGGRDTLSVLNQKGITAAISQYFGERIWLLWIMTPLIILLVFIYTASIAGTIFLISQRKWFELALLLVPIIYLLILPGPASQPRFRLPAMPYISLLAGIGILNVLQWFKAHSLQKAN